MKTIHGLQLLGTKKIRRGIFALLLAWCIFLCFIHYPFHKMEDFFMKPAPLHIYWKNYNISYKGERFNFSQHQDKQLFECFWMCPDPPAPICIYDMAIDRYVSKRLKLYRCWEPRHVKLIKEALALDSNFGFIDCGANLGVFSLSMAAMGHKVLAIDPVKENVLRMSRAVQMGGYQDRIILLKNILSDKRDVGGIHVNNYNVGGSVATNNCTNTLGKRERTCENVPSILLDDLKDFFQEDNPKAIMKIDIEGSEAIAFKKASKLFKKVYIPVVMMEWALLRDVLKGANSTNSTGESVKAIKDMINFFFIREYQPFAVSETFKHARNVTNTHPLHWPRDVVFVHKTFQQAWIEAKSEKVIEIDPCKGAC